MSTDWTFVDMDSGVGWISKHNLIDNPRMYQLFHECQVMIAREDFPVIIKHWMMI